MGSPPTNPNTPIVVANAAESFQNPVTFHYAHRDLTLHFVTEQELDAVASLSNSVHLTFLGVSFGALITLAITLSTVTISDSKVFAAFVACTVLSAASTLYFGIRAWISYREARRKLRELKSCRPLGSL
jgi:hypothetical protein